jgi:hypothetical protein
VSGVKAFRHPLVGELDLEFDAMQLGGGADGQRMFAYHAVPGSSSEAALQLLGAAASVSQPASDREDRRSRHGAPDGS